MNVRTNITITVNGEKLTSREIFRASGTTWIRYTRRNGDNGYATIAEWKAWLEVNFPIHAGMV